MTRLRLGEIELAAESEDWTRKKKMRLMTEAHAISARPTIDAWLTLCSRWRQAPFLLIVCTAIPNAVVAQTGDAAYCTQLSNLALRYTGSVGSNGNLSPDLTTTGAMEDCRKGDAAAGIPVLEKTLRSNGFTLPKR